MCIECGRIFCARRCPNHGKNSPERGKRILFCSRCGNGIYLSDLFSKEGTLTLCENCLRDLEAPSETTVVSKESYAKNVN